jgi:hypothetical protein
MKSLGRYRYFQQREEWKVTDMLMNPMVLMMLLPLLLITVLPKMMNDPETKREMEQMQQNMNVQSQVCCLSKRIIFIVEKRLWDIYFSAAGGERGDGQLVWRRVRRGRGQEQEKGEASEKMSAAAARRNRFLSF